MTPFEHLAVLISIVLGLGLTQLLLSAHRLVQARTRVRFYWLPLAWAALLVSLAGSRRPGLHTAVTLVVAALFGFFIVSAALQLR